VTSHPGELSLAIPSWVGAMSTSQRAVMPCGWGVKAGMGWQVKLCDPLVTHGQYLSALEMSL